VGKKKKPCMLCFLTRASAFFFPKKGVIFLKIRFSSIMFSQFSEKLHPSDSIQWNKYIFAI
ncbi:hypothetical protein ABTN09_20675, partial [Acinetobacter baumannii]